MFGLLAAIGTSVITMIISAVGVWFGGWVDELIQRITGVNLVLPTLPILIMIGAFYSRSIWLILGAVIALSIFGSGIVTYRSVFLQVKESPYIEAARSYGAGNGRIIMLYLMPRIVPMLIPTLVTAIPGYVFLEASLAVLGLGDPVLPTWGKIINDAQANGALYQGLYYWVLEPAVLLMITGLAFAMLGFSLDRIFNPRLRGQ
jgi:peptide/nickel transport system permease protein